MTDGIAVMSQRRGDAAPDARDSQNNGHDVGQRISSKSDVCNSMPLEEIGFVIRWTLGDVFNIVDLNVGAVKQERLFFERHQKHTDDRRCIDLFREWPRVTGRTSISTCFAGQ